MKSYLKSKYAFTTLLFSMLCATTTEASTVLSALDPSKIGIDVNQLFAVTESDDAILSPLVLNPELRPNGMAEPDKAIHLGTNTDLFAVGPDFWVRYTLDGSSYSSYIEHYSWRNMPPVNSQYSPTGSFWLSYNGSTLNATASKVIGDNLLFYGPNGYDFLFNQIAISDNSVPIQSFLNSVGSPFADAGWNSILNLSFLSLWNGGLYTSATGFDTVFYEHQYDVQYTLERGYNIAPVPVPSAVWLMGSGIIGIFGFAYRRIA